MFGGHGFFAPNGGMFAGIVTADEVILKLADEAARTELIAAGGHPWVYEGKGQAMTMKEWIVVPDGFYDDPELFAAWAKRAHRLVPPKLAKKKTPVKKAPPRATRKAPAKRRARR
jgi:DNA transformation protein and related proteins